MLSIPALTSILQIIQAARLACETDEANVAGNLLEEGAITCVPGSSRPVHEIPVLLEFCDFPKPLRPALVRNGDYVGKITWSQAAADRQLNPLQQPSHATPF